MDDEYWDDYEDVPTPLYIAVSNKNLTELARLLKISNDTINQRGSDDFTPLHVAINNHDITSVKTLLQHGADPTLQFLRSEAEFEQQSTAVTEAADLGHVDILRLFIEHGRPLLDGELKLLNLLISGGTDKHAVDCAFSEAIIPWHYHDDSPKRNCVRQGETEWPFETGKKRIEAVGLLLEAGADIEAPGRISLWRIPTMKPLHEAARDVWTALNFVAGPNSDQRKIDVSDILLAYEADINALSTEGWTVLYQTLLLDNGANMESKDAEGRTPLLRAVGVCENVMELLNHGADINVKDNAGLGFEERPKNEGYTITTENWKVVGFKKIPDLDTAEQ
ncbi:ankyrin [Cadophora sp. DSE1049]|nr:ankyrin [Cadophora sp. DSE1049]